MKDSDIVKWIVSHIKEGDTVRMSALPTHRGSGYEIRVECDRRCFPTEFVAGGLSCQKMVGIGRSRTTAEARAERIQKLLDKEMAKA